MQDVIPGLATLRQHLRESTAQHHDWARLYDPEALATALLDAAARAGMDAGDLRRAIATPPDAAPVDGWPPPGWLPIAIEGRSKDATVRWVCTARASFDAPFFADAIAPARHAPFNRLIDWRTPLDRLAIDAPGKLCLPDGLIFHWSRCGSTLAARMIEACSGVAVFAEPEPIDAVLASDDPALLRAMAAALLHGRPDSDRLILKLDCWHIASLSLFRRAFPEVPWVFLFRDPAAILASHARLPGSQMMPGKIAEFEDGWSVADHHAAVLGTIADAALKAFGDDADADTVRSGVAIDYATLPGAVMDRILPLFGIAPIPADMEAIAIVAGRDAKAPDRPFDSARDATGSGRITTAAERLRARYEALQRARDRA